MSEPTLENRVGEIPRVFDAAASERLCAALGPRLTTLGQKAQGLLAAVGGASPYLSRLIARSPEETLFLMKTAPEAAIADIVGRARAAGDASSPEETMAELRRAKRLAALLTALAEIGGVWDSLEAAAALSDFADAAVDSSLRAALKKQAGKGFLRAGEPDCERASGVAIIAMGKLGARELNYSSDIDLIVLFDPESAAFADAEAARAVSVAAARDLLRLMSERTPEGYVFRTDLRLRPDPGVTAAAISVRAAEAYYEAHGQNWERAAFIKARAAAGDIGVGERFIANLRPYVWRKYLDYAAIEDIHSIKRQIHAAKGGGAIEFFGHDVKTGRGGIREIEFLAQTQQLILGGKEPKLRERKTLDALSRLAEMGRLADADHATLQANYHYLRRVEHRLQMINDEQTHRIPRESEEVARLAAFLGEESPTAFESRLLETLVSTHRHFAELFEKEERLSSSAGSLIFTGVENDQATLATLSSLGFKRPADVSDVIRRWHTGSLRATRSPRARELLTKLGPRLLEELGRAGDPDAAFIAFDRFLAQLPAGVQVFSLFANNPHIFEDLIRIMTIAPELGRQLAKRAHLVEALLENDWPRPPPSAEAMRTELALKLQSAEGYEAKLNAARRWASERRFDVAAQLVIGAIAPDAAAAHFTAIADCCVAGLLPVARAETVSQLGDIDGGLVVIGLGRLGAGAMTAGSDIDLIFVYDAPAVAQSTGLKPVEASVWYPRYVRRALTALSAVTEEGSLFEVDMQLRPSGGAGPAAVSLSAFEKYYAADAWTWEAMALLKGRIVAGDAAAAAKVRAVMDAVLARDRPRAALARDVAEMRARLAQAKPAKGIWDVKLASGGLADLDFIVEFLALASGPNLRATPQLTAALINLLDNQSILAKDEARALRAAGECFETIMQLSRAATGEIFDPHSSGEALKMRMATALGAADIREAERMLDARLDDVRRLFEKIVVAAACSA
ncbi:MAG: bifunctional [glutamine synthetase] adenylyltransferase/[glutamine synthetase]-adenylyl-L-tyrosine phosphorylase [Parvularculaceae bacterium]|nr:bifunctional [glutamine synthetase] adenylyltransferase/[glutamine synthetase]-adenylyl-L-tyrosine phosphorylase [Parvularculaceae bacterium]